MDYAQRVAADAATAALIAQGAVVSAGRDILLGEQITGELAETILRTVPAQRTDEHGVGLYIGQHKGRMILYIRDWGELGLYWATAAATEQMELLENVRNLFARTV